MEKSTQYNSEQSMITAIKSGDQKALNFLYKKYYAGVQKMVLKNSGDESDAKDIYQDAVIVFYKKMQETNFELTCAVSTYLFSVSRNLWFKKLRNRGKEIAFDFSDSESFIDIQDEQELPEEGNSPSEELAIQTLKNLGDPCKTILEQFYFYKKSMKDIAQLLNYKNEKSAKNQKYKCMQRLQKAML